MADTIAFAKSLYSPDAVRAAAEAYGGLARIEVSEQNDDVVVTLSDPDASVAAEIADAFCNHALHETIIRRQKPGEPRP